MFSFLAYDRDNVLLPLSPGHDVGQKGLHDHDPAREVNSPFLALQLLPETLPINSLEKS